MYRAQNEDTRDFILNVSPEQRKEPGINKSTLWMAVFAGMGASILVTLNGMRLLRVRK